MKRLLIAICILIILTSSLSFAKETLWDTYSDTWSLYDELGRQTTSLEKREDKYVLIFYHIWHKDFMAPTLGADREAPRNISKIIRENEDALTNPNLWGPNISYHYWAEPLFGFYDLSKDDYVIRRHAQMLTDSGVDAIVIDYSNYMGGGGMAYSKDTLTKILDVYLEIREEGKKAPGISFLCTWSSVESAKALEDFYNDFYKNEKYKDLWFHYLEKPFVMANPDSLSQELKDYFTIRKPHPFYTPVEEENAWPWLSNYPQEPGYTSSNKAEVVAVGVAQNWSESLDFMSATDSDGNFIARGRSYASKEQKLLKDPISLEYESQKGINFQEAFDRAIELDPTVIFVTGFNEWIAARFLEIPSWARLSKDPVAPYGGFCDLFTSEFSRDIEPTREGGLNDNFYNQLAINIRRFKGTGKQAYESKDKTIQIDGDFHDWDEILLEYRDDMYDTAIRDARGIGRNNIYTNTSGRNDFKIGKVAYDKDNIYFYIETVDPISSYQDSSWMNLLIRINNDDSPSWANFQYILNRANVKDNFTCLEKSKGGWKWEIADEQIAYKVIDNRMELAIPLKSLSLDYSKGIDIDFKWFDNMQEEGDPLEFYTNGDTAPNQRFAYSFKVYSHIKTHKNNLLYLLLLIPFLTLILILAIKVKSKRKLTIC